MKLNIIANLIGRFWSVLIAIIAVPFYIKYLGIEAYGLIGFFLVLISTLSLLEFGLSVTINREIARYASIKEKSNYVCDLSRSLEIIYWIFGTILAFGIYLFAPVISKHWLHSEGIPIAIVNEAIILMGISIAFHWPISLYNGGLMGLEKQVVLNVLNACFSTVRALGAILLMMIFEPSITLFFKWQLGVLIIHSVLFYYLFWWNMPKGTRSPQFDKTILYSIWKFTAGMGGSGILTFLLSNLDKLVLSKILTLSDFGNYNVASTINNSSKLPASAVFSALFPRFSALYESGDHIGIRLLLHKGTQFIALMIFPISAVIFFYSYDIIYIWSLNNSLASSISLMLSIFILGSAINVLMGVLGDIVVASGLSMYIFYQNIISVVLIVPLMLLLARDYGGIGAAISWLILNIGYLFISVPILMNKTQPGEVRNWYLYDFFIPFIISFGVVGLGKFFIPSSQYLSMKIFVIVFVWIVSQLACLKSLPQMRDFISVWWAELKLRMTQ